MSSSQAAIPAPTINVLLAKLLRYLSADLNNHPSKETLHLYAFAANALQHVSTDTMTANEELILASIPLMYKTEDQLAPLSANLKVWVSEVNAYVEAKPKADPVIIKYLIDASIPESAKTDEVLHAKFGKANVLATIQAFKSYSKRFE